MLNSSPCPLHLSVQWDDCNCEGYDFHTIPSKNITFARHPEARCLSAGMLDLVYTLHCPAVREFFLTPPLISVPLYLILPFAIGRIEIITKENKQRLCW